MYFPDFLDEDLKDLIDQLLVVHPKDRLGAELIKGENTIDDLKSHKFFQGIDFKDIHKRSPPLSKNERLTMELNRKAKQVPIDKNEVDSDEDNINRPQLEKAQSTGPFVIATANGIKKSNTANPDPNMTMNRPSKASKVQPDLLDPVDDYDDVNVIKEAIVEKRNKWYFYQDRTLKLTKDLRLMYFKKGNYRGDIVFSKKMSVRKEKVHHFDIITPNKVFYFRCKQGDSASQWVKVIKNAIKAKVEKDKAGK